MKPDPHLGFQEVRQAFAETPARHTGICRKLRQLQSSQEGLGESIDQIGPVANMRTAHQTAERYPDSAPPKCYQRHPRKP